MVGANFMQSRKEIAATIYEKRLSMDIRTDRIPIVPTQHCGGD